MALKLTKFVTGQNVAEGLPGYMSYLWPKYGTATVLNGQTAIVVTDTTIRTGDLIIASVLTKGTNAAYVVGTAISNLTSFTITVNTDPGSGGAVIAFIVLRPTS